MKAQPVNKLYLAKIDSLQALIVQQPKDDTTKVKRLHYLARFCFSDMQFQRGLLATLQARQLANQLHYAKGDALYWTTLDYLNAYTPHTYSYYYFLSRWSYRDRKQTEEVFQLGGAIPDFRKNPKAKAQMLTAIHYYETHLDREILANLLLTYVGYIPREEQPPYLEKAIRLFRENNQPALPFFIKRHEMVLFEKEGKTKEAKETEIEARTILTNTKDSREKALMYYFLGQIYASQGRRDLSFEFATQADKLLEKFGEKDLRIGALYRLGIMGYDLNLHRKTVEYLKKAVALAAEDKNRNAARLADHYLQIAFSLISLNEFEEAKYYIEKSRKVPLDQYDGNFKKIMIARHYDATGQLLMGQGDYQGALKNFTQALSAANQTTDSTRLGSYMTLYMAQCYQKLGQLQESIKYGKMSYAKASPQSGQYRSATLLLADVFEEAGQPLEAYTYLKEYQKLRKESDQKDEANYIADVEIRSAVEKEEQEKNQIKQEKLLQAQQILAIEKQREIDGLKAQAANQLLQTRAEQAELDKELEKERLEARAFQNKRQQDYQISLLNLDIDNQRKIRTGLLGGLALFALFVLVLVRQNRIKQRFNQTLTKQKAEIEHKRDQLDHTLTELKTTQTQLIQKEKLASLGELTAGIAHEIQNPLNFVNNFSEVSTELIDELKEGPFQKLPEEEKEYAEEILSDLTSNLRKINHHGGRASSIVKGMLEHSRTESGEKRPTDLNALTDEYLKIAYHGLRAKDKSFNCTLVTDFAPTLEPVDVASQEIGRVLLNLFNNAFYAISAQSKKRNDSTFQPTVEVRTKRKSDHVVIQVRDNGGGIPEQVKAKIFQPFFTTKPTGEGTGLGLSLSYDIITKGHGGILSVESTEGPGTTFIIQLPA
ncbi:ATP-binding protein [Spirosoma daeguense]